MNFHAVKRQPRLTVIEIRTLVAIGRGQVVPIEADAGLPRSDSTDGVLVFAVNGMDLLDQRFLTEVDWRWEQLVDAFAELLETGRGHARTWSPGPDIIIESAPSHWVRIAVSDRRTAVPLGELADALESAGVHFFRELGRLCTRDPIAEQRIEQLEALAQQARTIVGWRRG